MQPTFCGFLQRMCGHPRLKHSQLLAIFLQSPDELKEDSLVAMLNPWRGMKKVVNERKQD